MNTLLLFLDEMDCGSDAVNPHVRLELHEVPQDKGALVKNHVVLVHSLLSNKTAAEVWMEVLIPSQ